MHPRRTLVVVLCSAALFLGLVFASLDGRQRKTFITPSPSSQLRPGLPQPPPPDNGEPETSGGGGLVALRGRGTRLRSSSSPAIVANRLKDFEGVDDSLVFPRGAAPEIRNITQTAPRTFRFELRFRGNPWAPNNPGGQRGAWYDGDRDLQWNEGRHKSFKGKGGYKDKSRAEVCCLRGYGTRQGPKLGMGETWDIAATVRLDEDFVPSKGYCNIMQPVFDQSYLNLKALTGNVVRAELVAFSDGILSKQNLVREFDIPRGQWVSIVVRVRFARNGRYELSVNGDAFRGIGIDTTKGRQPFGPKWGLYMTATKDVNGRPMRDAVALYRDIYIRRVA